MLHFLTQGKKKKFFLIESSLESKVPVDAINKTRQMFRLLAVGRFCLPMTFCSGFRVDSPI